MLADAASPAAQQCDSAAGVAALDVREAHGNLSQALPQLALGGRRRLPRCLEHFMRAKRPAVVDQLLRERKRAAR